MRAALVVVGTAAIGYGGWLLLSTQSLAQGGAVLVWAGGAVVAHDLLLVPVVLALGWLVRRYGRDPVARTAVAVLVLLGPVTLAAIPVFVGLGADPAMPTLLGRDYGLGWGVLAIGIVGAGAALAASRILSGGARGRSTRGTDPRRR
ncbi:hypothetical protein KVF89_15605 [Nocardioides carbamazepini]|jgi:hypothetical protein|uniref:hypothetical protein n=1 Tax=Nocardioides carbamazepini TaxID=2854259 RepID=UPI002149A0BC|nr:hypothetical protein [Nocardioides carbamazepini]MCR1783967.1 hypothetical protein [Nocardioides carbamazepini]